MPFEAVELFREMMIKTCETNPNSVTMSVYFKLLRKGLDSILPVISARVVMYAKLSWELTGLVEEGKRLFKSMQRDHKMRPGMEHYACMVDLLACKVVYRMRPKLSGNKIPSFSHLSRCMYC
ncbi:hypothetical protein EZV62_022235 [Acer yangbiense]|uniref:Pentacotripeptide-repeat region of PRORP domain-containing protein n=1 Tax=Acer yangbiense TaxID=1000413 RepID=A0A5C7HA38_9ROSI|nr:hypothetical protein EZV62_022235 [Acer yangbiense]